MKQSNGSKLWPALSVAGVCGMTMPALRAAEMKPAPPKLTMPAAMVMQSGSSGKKSLKVPPGQSVHVTKGLLDVDENASDNNVGTGATVIVDDGGELRLNGATLANGGTIQVDPGGCLRLATGAKIKVGEMGKGKIIIKGDAAAKKLGCLRLENTSTLVPGIFIDGDVDSRGGAIYLSGPPGPLAASKMGTKSLVQDLVMTADTKAELTTIQWTGSPSLFTITGSLNLSSGSFTETIDPPNSTFGQFNCGSTVRINGSTLNITVTSGTIANGTKFDMIVVTNPSSSLIVTNDFACGTISSGFFFKKEPDTVAKKYRIERVSAGGTNICP